MHGPILKLLFPNATDGAFILQISSVGIIFTVLDQTVNGALQGIGKIMTPTISLGIGVTIKFVLNLCLVQNPKFGVAGAAFATCACHAVAFVIGYRVLIKSINLNLNFSNFILKPILATTIMGICSYSSYFLLNSITSEKMATIISIIFAILVYIIAIIVLKIFKKEEINMLPCGKKICKSLEIMGLYK